MIKKFQAKPSPLSKAPQMALPASAYDDHDKDDGDGDGDDDDDEDYYDDEDSEGASPRPTSAL